MAGTRAGKATARKAALLINVTRGREDLHAVSMALGLARSALDEGHRVIVFFNVAAPIFASSALGEDVQQAGSKPISQQVRDIVRGGGRVLVCSHCLAVANIDRSSLLPGVALAQHGDLLTAIEPGMVGVSY
jgi:predicted peroxiredoxin